jgi:hypothetical protein
MKPLTGTDGKRIHRGGGLLFCALLAGAFLLMHFSERFVFFYEESYTRMALWSSLVSAPLVLYCLRRSPFFSHELAKKYPTAWLRHWVVMPITALFLAGLAWTAPLGWLLGAVSWAGGESRHVRALAVKVEAPARRKGCRQYASLRFASAEKKTCIDGQPHDLPVRTGQALDVGITAMPFGFLIDSLAPADNASS